MEEAEKTNPTSCNNRPHRSICSAKSNSGFTHDSSGYGSYPSMQGSVGTDFTKPAILRRKKKRESQTALDLPAPAVEGINGNEEDGSITKPEDTQPEKPDWDNAGKPCGLELGREVVFGVSASPYDDEAVHIATINQTLNYIQKLERSSIEKSPVSTMTIEVAEGKEEISEPSPLPTKNNRITTQEFTIVISMGDGFVKYTSSGITDVLGFPIDMWIGRSITDFLQPKDRAAFASHITSDVASPLTQTCKIWRRSPFFCHLRCYRGLQRSGFGVKDKPVRFRPCKLMLSFRDHLSGSILPEEPHFDVSDTESVKNSVSAGVGLGVHLVVTVSPITSAYTCLEKVLTVRKFATRLLSSTHFCEVDPDCVRYLGFFPQDLIGHSVLEFYHPEDMSFMKNVYETVIRKPGETFLSKPYRFRTQNGGYILLETEWSSFSNPWSRKLEFILAQHCILEGPPNPDVFATPPEEASSILPGEIQKSKEVQEEIKKMLNVDLPNSWFNSKRHYIITKVQALKSSFEETEKSESPVEVHPKGQSVCERDSISSGKVLQHHEYHDSQSSTETPPSYNQLNYVDKIQRFFESKPETTRSEESGKEKSGTPENHFQVNSSTGSGDSGSGDGGTSSSYNSHLQPMLTEAILSRHNEDEKKRMVQNFRVQQNKGDERDKDPKATVGVHNNHGVKRIGSQSWENDSFKGSKHLHVDNQGTLPGKLGNVGGNPTTLASGVSMANAFTVVVTSCGPTCTGFGNTPTSVPSSTTVVQSSYQYSQSTMRPPYSVTVTQIPSSSSRAVRPLSSCPMFGTSPHLTSPYFMGPHPPFMVTPSFVSAGPNQNYPLIYQPLLCPPISMVHHPPTMLPASLFPDAALAQPNQMQSPASNASVAGQASQPSQPHQQSIVQQRHHQTSTPHKVEGPTFHIPSNSYCRLSQANTVKAELGSVIGSAASAPLCALLVSSTGNKSLSPCDKSSPDEDKASGDSNKCSERHEDENSFCTSLGSYLCTDNSDESMRSCKELTCKKGCSCWSPGGSMGSDSNTSLAKSRPVRADLAPWMANVSMTDDLIHRYELSAKNVGDVLKADLAALEKIKQPALVNDQLNQLYKELSNQGSPTQLALDEGNTTSSGSGSEEILSNSQQSNKTKKKRKSIDYGRLIIFFEENAPMPPPNSTVATVP